MYVYEPQAISGFFGEAKCPDYTAGEVQTSRTEKGHLPFDVIQHDRGLLISDFGVDWRHVKESTKKEKLLRDWLDFVKGLRTPELRIFGFSDCVGNEKNNLYLRRERARQ